MDGSLEYFAAAINSLRPSFDIGGGEVEDRGVGEAVRIFLAEIPNACFELPAAADVLCAADRHRLDSLRHPRRRAQFVAGRMLLGHAIEQTFGASADAWRIDTLPSGGVRLACEDSFVAASISHSDRLVGCAVALRGRVGIDVERLRPRGTPWAGLAAAVLHPVDLAAVESLEEHERWVAFYRHWTCKEALVKALGSDLHAEFSQIQFSAGFQSVAIGDVAKPLHGVRFAALDCGDDVVGAVAWFQGSDDSRDLFTRSPEQ